MNYDNLHNNIMVKTTNKLNLYLLFIDTASIDDTDLDRDYNPHITTDQNIHLESDYANDNLLDNISGNNNNILYMHT